MADNDSIGDPFDAAIPVLSNRLILYLIATDRITINPFNIDRLAPTAYQLCPHRVRYRIDDENGNPLEDTIIELVEDEWRDLRPGEYAVVSPIERITLAPGIVADFYPSSLCIEKELILTAGRLDENYQEDLVFGVFNAGRYNVRLTSEFQLTRVTFGWLGVKNIPLYSDEPPGTYIPDLALLRRRSVDINTSTTITPSQKKKIVRLKVNFPNYGGTVDDQ